MCIKHALTTFPDFNNILGRTSNGDNNRFRVPTAKNTNPNVCLILSFTFTPNPHNDTHPHPHTPPTSTLLCACSVLGWRDNPVIIMRELLHPRAPRTASADGRLQPPSATAGSNTRNRPTATATTTNCMLSFFFCLLRFCSNTTCCCAKWAKVCGGGGGRNYFATFSNTQTYQPLGEKVF